MKQIMKLKKIWIAFITIFISGIIIGWVAGGMVRGRQNVSRRSNAMLLKNRIVDHMAKRLDFDDQQYIQAEKIVEGMTTQIRLYQAEQRPKIKAVIDKAMGNIEKLLTPEQLNEFSAMRKRMAVKRRRRYRDHRKRKPKSESGRREATRPERQFDPENEIDSEHQADHEHEKIRK